MKYISEINSFYDWLETNSISDSGIVLWHALMHICNKAGWITEFAVAISTLETKTGLKKGAIIRARQRLQQAGRIDFKSRAGQQSAIYTIIPFNNDDNNLCSIKERNMEHKPDTNWNANRTQSETQTGTINRLDKTNNNDDNNAGTRKGILLIKTVSDQYRILAETEKMFLLDWQQEFPDDVILECVKRAHAQGQLSISYMRGIFNNWHQQAVKTLDDIRRLDELWEAKKNKAKARENYSTESHTAPDPYCHKCQGSGYVEAIVDGSPYRYKCSCWKESPEWARTFKERSAS